jgi:hypothetical protein
MKKQEKTGCITMFSWHLESLVVTIFAWHALCSDQFTQAENLPFSLYHLHLITLYLARLTILATAFCLYDQGQAFHSDQPKE